MNMMMTVLQGVQGESFDKMKERRQFSVQSIFPAECVNLNLHIAVVQGQIGQILVYNLEITRPNKKT